MGNEIIRRNRDKIDKKEGDYEVQSRERLAKIISKKLEKTFIGNISEFESKFGFLWGHGKKESELDTDEAYFRKLWKELRNTILNKGNDNIRAVQDELDQYTIHWNRYQITLIPDERYGQ